MFVTLSFILQCLLYQFTESISIQLPFILPFVRSKSKTSNIRQHWNCAYNYFLFFIRIFDNIGIVYLFPYNYFLFFIRIFDNIGIVHLFPHNYFLFFIRIFVNTGIAYFFPYNYLLFFVLSYFIDPNIRQHWNYASFSI